MGDITTNKQIRRLFYQALLSAMIVVWQIFSLLLGSMVILGLIVGRIEGWQLFDGVYFAFVTGLTVGYGDLVPKQHLSRILAVAIGFTGILLTALFAAVSVRALENTVHPTANVQGERP